MSRLFQLARFLCPIGFGLMVCITGCHLLQLNLLRTTPDPADRPESAVQPADRTSFRLAPYVFQADFELDRRWPVFRDLEQLREQVYRELQLPDSSRIIQVNMYRTREKYEKAVKARWPQLPPRPAFFVAQPRALGGGEDLLVYTFWGDKIQEDLRHELTHALLHSVLHDVPIWLDEGLAEYFETPPAWKGINPRHLETLRSQRNDQFEPNLDRLEKLKDVPEMKTPEYRESWAWVHFMLRGDPRARQALIDYLRDLRNTSKPEPLRPRLQAISPDLRAAFWRHLDRLDVPRSGSYPAIWQKAER
jgi:hypothetical protein